MAKKILVVEDEPSLLGALQNKLTQEGFEYIEARNGQIGLEKALQEKPDLILLDIIMPVMDGLTMLNKLREDEWGKTAPVIVLTNLSDDEKVMEAVKQGSYDYLIKSNWSINEVISKIKDRLKM